MSVQNTSEAVEFSCVCEVLCGLVSAYYSPSGSCAFPSVQVLGMPTRGSESFPCLDGMRVLCHGRIGLVSGKERHATVLEKALVINGQEEWFCNWCKSSSVWTRKYCTI